MYSAGMFMLIVQFGARLVKMYLELCVLCVFLIGVGYCLLWYHYDYWTRHGVPQLKPQFFIGNLGGMLSMSSSPADFISDLYNDPNAVNEPFVGIHMFHKPAILARDPALIKRIMIKDFQKFSNRYSNSDYKGDPLGSQNIFFLKNPAWKEVRFKLTPFFTANRLKNMFHLIEEVGCNLDVYLRNRPLDNEKTRSFTLEMKELCALYTTDVIATVAYGIAANSFKQPNGEFRRHGRAVFEFSLLRAAEFTLVFFLPQLVPFFGFKVLPPESTKFLRRTIDYVMTERERSGCVRHDLIDILLEFRKSSREQAAQQADKLVFEGDMLLAQAAIFFTAGFESSSSTMAFALYELAKQPAIQQRLRAEIKAALIANDGHVTQKMIDSLEYMQMILYEVLRLYPPLPFLDRECTIDKGVGNYSLEPFHAQFRIPRGMPIYIPVYGLHMDPKYYPEPKSFKPERFSAENRKRLTPYTYMPFGLGPHGCIGERFGFLQAKIGLVYFLRNHYVTTCERTPRKMKLDSKAIILKAAGGIHLKIVREPLGI